MSLFDDVGKLYVAAVMGPSWNRFGRRPDAVHALELFCDSYVYERAGASPDYAPAATLALAAAAPDPVAVWSEFREVVGGPVNPRLNPLWHRKSDACDCALCFLGDDGGVRNIVSWARQMIATDQVDVAHKELRRIRGVGAKVASFFLRDVALRHGLAPEANRWLLQPVDLWVKRFTLMLDPGRGASDPAVAQWMTAHSDAPELANAGMWYFGARIVPRRLDYTPALKDPAVARDHVQRYVERLDAAVRAWHTVRSR
jgi:hypothetical protein